MAWRGPQSLLSPEYHLPRFNRVDPVAIFVDVSVVAHPRLPQGFFGRWRLAEGREAQTVRQVFYSPDDGADGQYDVLAAWINGRRTLATLLWVWDSAAGLSALVIGGDHGLRLSPVSASTGNGTTDFGTPGLWLSIENTDDFAETYLLLADRA